MRPVHKFNTESTLCNNCRVVISNQLIDTLYCHKCKGYGKQASSEGKEEVRERGLDSDQHDKAKC
jgi:hypothetical protein